MMNYIRNRDCSCTRCRAHSLMGAAVLITLGVLFLLETYFHIEFHRTFPVLLLVIGCVLLISRTGSMEGHVNPAWYTAQMQPPQNPQQWTAGPSAPQPPANSPANPNDPQVKS
jgi:hypothetical protein